MNDRFLCDNKSCSHLDCLSAQHESRRDSSSITDAACCNDRDGYRINDLREAFDFGYEEYFYSGDLCLVEWPEKIEQLLPDNTMTVRITVDSDTARTFEID